MKYYGAAMLLLATLLLPASGWGRCDCKEASKPELPAGLADAQEMEKAGKEIDAYVKEVRQYRDCLMKCVSEADNELSSVIGGWNYSVDRFNASATDKPKSSR